MRINLVRWKTIKTITVGCVSEKQIAKCQHFSLLLQSDWNGQIPIPWRGSNIFLTWQEIFPRVAAKFPWRMKDEDCGWEFPFSCVNVKSFHRMEEICECAGKCAFRRNAPTTPPLLLNSSFLTNYLMEVSHAKSCECLCGNKIFVYLQSDSAVDCIQMLDTATSVPLLTPSLYTWRKPCGQGGWAGKEAVIMKAFTRRSVWDPSNLANSHYCCLELSNGRCPGCDYITTYGVSCIPPHFVCGLWVHRKGGVYFISAWALTLSVQQ